MSNIVTSFTGHFRSATLAAACVLALSLGGCASGGQGLLDSSLSQQLANTAPPAPGDLQAATVYWQKAYEQNPQEAETAMNFAHHLKLSGNPQAALNVLSQASVLHGNNPQFASAYGRMALENGQIELAQRLLASADNPARPDWKIISARATATARSGDYDSALPMFKRAHAIAPNEPTTINNLAMAYVASGDVTSAEQLLRPIAMSTRATTKVKQNYALVLGLQGRYTEAKAFAADGANATEAYDRIERVRDLVKLPENNLAVPQSEPVAFRPGAAPAARKAGQAARN